jgi:hypothetical protein
MGWTLVNLGLQMAKFLELALVICNSMKQLQGIATVSNWMFPKLKFS